MMHTYKKTESQLWTVGYYDKEGKFQPLKDFSEEIQAIFFVNYLNGGKQDISIIKDLL